MIKKIEKERANAVRRYLSGEEPEGICASLSKTTRWLYKWVSRHTHDDPAWCEEHSRRPHFSPDRTPAEVEDVVKKVRLNLYNKGLFCGNQAIQWEMSNMAVQPIPSLSTIGRILRRCKLTQRRTGRYESKGKKYPELPAMRPNQTHQLDFVGPCYLTGPTRFYSLNAIDPAINLCGIEPISSRSAQSVLSAVYAVWQRMGIPENLQVDNELAFFGSPAHPRSLGPLIRLCLHYGVNLWFVPPSEPWRNGVVEKFNDHYRQKFLSKITMTSMMELRQESFAFEHRHNSTYRYNKIKWKTPLRALACTENKLVFPNKTNVPKHPLKKPKEGRYHFVRFIRSDLRLNIFGEMFPVPPEAQYEYVVAAIDVKEQKLKLLLDKTLLKEYNYPLR